MAPNGTIYIVDDDDAVRNSVVMLLAAAGYETKSFSSAKDFLGIIQTLEPGCLISDVRMPGMDGIALLNHVKTLGLNFPVILITGFGDIAMAVKAIKLGAVDFVEKSDISETILAAVRHAQEEMVAARPADEAAHTAKDRLAHLTSREREVLERLVVGMPNKIIAHDLSISPRTVEFHRANVMAKTQAGSLSQLVRLALASGIKVEPEH